MPARLTPHQKQTVAGAMIAFLVQAEQMIDDEKRVTPHPFDAFNHRRVTSSELREIMQNLGDADVPRALLAKFPGVTEGEVRPDVAERFRETSEARHRVKEELMEMLRQAMSNETNIWRTKEKEIEVVRGIWAYDSPKGILENVLKRIRDKRIVFTRDPAMYQKHPVMFTEQEKKEITERVSGAGKIFEIVIGEMLERQENLGRQLEIAEGKIVNYKEILALTPEQIQEVEQVREKVTQRDRAFVARRKLAYIECIHLLRQFLGVFYEARDISDLEKIEGAIFGSIKEKLTAVQSVMKPGKAFREEKNLFEKLGRAAERIRV